MDPASEFHYLTNNMAAVWLIDRLSKESEL